MTGAKKTPGRKPQSAEIACPELVGLLRGLYQDLTTVELPYKCITFADTACITVTHDPPQS